MDVRDNPAVAVFVDLLDFDRLALNQLTESLPGNVAERLGFLGGVDTGVDRGDQAEEVNGLDVGLTREPKSQRVVHRPKNLGFSGGVSRKKVINDLFHGQFELWVTRITS